MNQEQNNLDMQVNNEMINNQDSMSNQTLQQPTKYASFGERLKAVLWDCLYAWWVPVLIYFISTILSIYFKMLNINMDLSIIQIAIPIIFIIYGQPFYAMFGDASKMHASKGKIKQNILVINSTGNYLTFGQSFCRMLLKYITLIIPGGLLITIITLCCTKKTQALHDLILGHTVVKK